MFYPFRKSGNPTYAFTRQSGPTPSGSTGPSAGPGGSGYYYFAETSSPRSLGDLFTLSYNGSACAASGQVISTVAFQYHMYGETMGTLSLVDASGAARWSLSGQQGDQWQAASVALYAPFLQFEYVRGSSWTGDAAIAQVTLSRGATHLLISTKILF